MENDKRGKSKEVVESIIKLKRIPTQFEDAESNENESPTNKSVTVMSKITAREDKHRESSIFNHFYASMTKLNIKLSRDLQALLEAARGQDVAIDSFQSRILKEWLEYVRLF